MELHNTYTNILESNVNGISKGEMINTLISSLTSKYYCKNSRDEFLLSYQKSGSKELNNKASMYLDCHSNMLKKTKNSCSDKFQSSFKCLNENGNLSMIPKDCVGQLEDLIQCLNK